MTPPPHPPASLPRKRPRSFSIAGLVLPLFLVALLEGCRRFEKPPKPEIVYVVTQQTYLRDRIAPIANRIALVRNGEPLEVVERDRRFFKVKTAKNEIGWIEEHLVIEEPVYDQFVALGHEHEHDPVVATGVLRNDLYLHLKPGRATERFYLLPENDKVQLLERASIAKPNPQQVSVPSPSPGKPAAPKPAAPPVPMEDWWLVRDAQGHAGWLLARSMDVDVPDAIGQYSEGQKMVGAYVLNEVDDPQSSLPDHEVPQYLAVLNPYKDGLPYDFNQIRVFTWNVKKHRYETAFRQRNLEGYLPVEITHEQLDGSQPSPVFAVKVAANDATTVDALGVAHPVETQTLRFQLDGNVVRKVLPASGEAAAPVKPHPALAQGERHSLRKSRPKRRARPRKTAS